MSHASFRPTGSDLRALLRLALPLVAVQLGQMGMGVVDTMMIGHVSSHAMAAVTLGNLYSMTLALLAMGLLMILDPLVSQAVGAGDADGARRAIQRGLVLATLLTVPVGLASLPTGAVFRALKQPEESVAGAALFTHVSILGTLPFLYVAVFRQALQAKHQVRPIVVAMLVANVVNAGLNWLFVFGHAGSALEGVAGSALATSLSRWFLLGLLLVIAWPELRPYLVPWRRDAFDGAALRRIALLGLPIAVQFGLEMGAFNVTGLLIGRRGVAALDGHQIALNLASFTFMVPLGVAMASSVLVGNAIGRGDAASARRSAGAGLLCGAGFMCASALTFLVMPGILTRLYNDDAAVFAVATALLPIAGVFQVFDGVQCVASGILRGAGEARIPAAANLVGYWILGLPFGWWLAKHQGHGPQGLWWGLTVGLAAVALLLLWRTFHVLGRDVRRLDAEAAPAA